MRPGEINVDPIEGEFFTTEAIGSITDGLVRESIQNSLDAAAGDGPVTICFSFYSNPDRSSDPRVFCDGVCPRIAVTDRADVKLVNIVDIDRKYLSGKRSIG